MMAQLEGAEAQTAYCGAFKLADGQTDFRQNPTYFAIDALVNLDCQRGGNPPGALESDAIALHAPFGEIDALAEFRDGFLVCGSANRDLVSLWHAETWMREPLRKFAVVGENDESATIDVEPADAVEPLSDVSDKIGDRGPALVGHVGADDAARLVKHDVDWSSDVNALAVEANFRTGLDLGAEFADDLAVNGHATLDDELFALATAGNAGVGENLLKPFGHKGVA